MHCTPHTPRTTYASHTHTTRALFSPRRRIYRNGFTTFNLWAHTLCASFQRVSRAHLVGWLAPGRDDCSRQDKPHTATHKHTRIREQQAHYIVVYYIKLHTNRHRHTYTAHTRERRGLPMRACGECVCVPSPPSTAQPATQQLHTARASQPLSASFHLFVFGRRVDKKRRVLCVLRRISSQRQSNSIINSININTAKQRPQ